MAAANDALRFYVPVDERDRATEATRRREQEAMLASLREEEGQWRIDRDAFRANGNVAEADRPFPKLALIARLEQAIGQRWPMYKTRYVPSRAAKDRAAFLAKRMQLADDIGRGRELAADREGGFARGAAMVAAREHQRKEQGEFMRAAARELLLQGGVVALAANDAFKAADMLDPPVPTRLRF